VVRDRSEHFALEDWSPYVRARFDRTSALNVTSWVATGESLGQPAHVLAYRCDDVPLVLDMVSSGARVQGITNTHGHICVARDSGTLLEGDLFEYLFVNAQYQHREVRLRMSG
jgi:hypothetical protein